MNVESNGYASSSDHYSEIDKASGGASPSPSLQTCWPEDLQSSEAAAAAAAAQAATTYANVVSRNLPHQTTPPPPPPPVGPNESPTKPSKNNVDIAQSMNELAIDTAVAASPKKLDPAFLAELEKHLGEKEATKNTNPNQHAQQVVPPQPIPAAPSNVVPVAAAAATSSSNNTVIPMLRPPPQSIKPKSPNGAAAAAPANFNFPSKVQNSWQPKSINIQRPRSQASAAATSSSSSFSSSVECSSTEALVAQMWHQNQSATSAYASNLLQCVPNHAPSNLESAPQNVAVAYQQQFPSLPPPNQTNLRNGQSQPGASNASSSTLPRPASIAGTVLSEQVYAELKQTVPNLEQLSQSEFNTLYNKTVRQNILRSYHANSNALATATNSMVSLVLLLLC